MKMMMKRRFWILAALMLSCLAMTGLSSCSDDDDDQAPGNKEFTYNLSEVKVAEQGTINPKEFLQDAIQKLTSDNADEETQLRLDYYKELLQQVEQQEQHLYDSLKAANPGNDASTILNQLFEKISSGYVVLNHPGTLADGSTGTLSTLVVYPLTLGISTDANRIILGCHFTVTGNHEVPTSVANQSFENIGTDTHLLIADWVTSFSAMLVMPDYEGYGASHLRSHPYLSREVQARQCLESVSCAIAWFTGQHKKQLSKFCKIASVGYSQGGAVSAATYRYYLEHRSTEQWVKNLPEYIGAVCGDGPYDPLATVMTYIESDMLFMPVAPALVLKALCETDPDMIKAGCTVNDFCTQGFINTKIFERLATKRSTTDMCDKAIFDYADKHPDSLKYITVSGRKVLPTEQAFNQATITYLRTGNLIRHAPEEKLKTLKNCLMKNRLFHNFTLPDDARFTFFHSLGDEVVPYSNLQSVINTWGNSVKAFKYNTQTKTHVGTGAVFYVGVAKHFINALFAPKWKGGITESDDPNAYF